MVVPAPSVQVATIRSCSGATARRWTPPARLNLLLEVPRSYKRRLQVEQPRKAKSNTPPALFNLRDLTSKKRRQNCSACWLFYCKCHAPIAPCILAIPKKKTCIRGFFVILCSEKSESHILEHWAHFSALTRLWSIGWKTSALDRSMSSLFKSFDLTFPHCKHNQVSWSSTRYLQVLKKRKKIVCNIRSCRRENKMPTKVNYRFSCSKF